ncbi:hypothetical protein SNE40_016747 [Patella caerulea]|uniref:Uncharacterized protein n=1 Tax=Patella caerulea TaxID=87958 RepID=A0AAN8PCS2_PATCE
MFIYVVLIYKAIPYKLTVIQHQGDYILPAYKHAHFHRRYKQQTGSLFILNNEKISDNSLHGVQNIPDAHYVQIAESVRSMVDGIKMSIEQGASWIYLPSSNQHLRQTLTKFNYKNELSSLIYSGPNKNDVSFHFIAQKFNNPDDFKRTYDFGKYGTPSIQTLFQVDPQQFKSMDYRAPPVTVRTSPLYPFTQQNTLYSYKAFWALIPLQVNSAIWSLWTGRLLMELEDYMAFYAPPDVGIQGISEEHSLHEFGEMRRASLNWKCDERVTFFTCMVDLSQVLKDKAIFTDDDVSMVTRWIEELLSSGYSEPQRKTQNTKIHFLNKMLFWPSNGVAKKLSKTEIFNGTCSKSIDNCDTVKPIDNVRFNDVLLIIVINMPGYYHVIDYMESLYKPIFPQRLYCSSNMTSLNQFYRNLKYKEISFIEVSFFHGQFGHQCIQKAHQLKYDVIGYLHLSDDVMVNLWNLASLPLDRIWFQHDMKVGKFTDKTVADVASKPNWWPWGSSIGINGVKKAFSQLINVTNSNLPMSDKVHSFFKTLATNAGGSSRAFYQASDIHYVPIHMADDYVYFVDYFNKNRVHLEITVPTVLNGLTPNKNIVKLPGNYLWHEKRRAYREVYKQSDVFLHPMKLASCMKNPTCYQFYCKNYISCWYNV